ncbi:multidrug resistance protein CDR1 [Cladophialophora immunda]|uniref:Multidrug resistance protein CDR1 n=1 Tax=Cladophialophora immunda TaxID=569365 RepID=A0A0D2C2V7_9EURO|nr:multidrug resistance protein CDR1 [Cladophialophora immunda]KIW25518.1 multidrug resistance protein CDR1 [Cladophialophora immunda]
MAGEARTAPVSLHTRLRNAGARRVYQRIWNDATATATTVGGNVVMWLIIASLLYGTPFGTLAFFAKSSLLLFAVLLNSLLTVTEINSLYTQRPIVEKHKTYAFYHPSTEALAGIVSDITIKIASNIVFNPIVYFLGGLRYEAGPYFILFIVNFATLLTMSCIFRTVAAANKTIAQALAIVGAFLLAVVIYTGFAFKALIVNEFHGRDFPCSNVIPAYLGFSTGVGVVTGDMLINVIRSPFTYIDRERGSSTEIDTSAREMLDETEFAGAVIGTPGQGLNVEQRKLLKIGVEPAAKLTVLLFLGEPTSGLYSQSSWTIVSFLRKPSCRPDAPALGDPLRTV